MNIPSVEQLKFIGTSAALMRSSGTDADSASVAAIRDAVVAACRPQLRPIEEMPNEVPEGCVRFLHNPNQQEFGGMKVWPDTHFIDIALPEPTYPADFEQAIRELGWPVKDKAAAFKLWKGGAK